MKIYNLMFEINKKDYINKNLFINRNLIIKNDD